MSGIGFKEKGYRNFCTFVTSIDTIRAPTFETPESSKFFMELTIERLKNLRSGEDFCGSKITDAQQHIDI